MKTLVRLGLGLTMTAALGLAVTYHGQLMDASCYQQNAPNTGHKIWVRCAPTDATTAFALHTRTGTIRMLDSAGNNKATTAMRDGALKRDPNGDMPVVINGVRHGKTIQVSAIRARGSKTTTQ